MLYISSLDTAHDRIGVTDTDDGVETVISSAELREVIKTGLKVHGVGRNGMKVYKATGISFNITQELLEKNVKAGCSLREYYGACLSFVIPRMVKSVISDASIVGVVSKGCQIALLTGLSGRTVSTSGVGFYPSYRSDDEGTDKYLYDSPIDIGVSLRATNNIKGNESCGHKCTIRLRTITDPGLCRVSRDSVRSWSVGRVKPRRMGDYPSCVMVSADYWDVYCVPRKYIDFLLSEYFNNVIYPWVRQNVPLIRELFGMCTLFGGVLGQRFSYDTWGIDDGNDPDDVTDFSGVLNRYRRDGVQIFCCIANMHYKRGFDLCDCEFLIDDVEWSGPVSPNEFERVLMDSRCRSHIYHHAVIGGIAFVCYTQRLKPHQF